MNTLIQDVRYALRGLQRTPGASFVAIATLAVALGLNTSVFSLLNAINLRPLPYGEPEQLLELYSVSEAGLGGGSSAADVADWRTRSRSFEGMALHQERAFDIEIGEQKESLSGARVSGDLFGVLAVRAQRGRTLLPQDHADAGVVVLSHVLWRDRFGSDPNVLGRTMRISGRSYEVVGVMPEHFGFPMFAQFWIPIPDHGLFDRADRQFSVVARKKSGISDRDAAREIGTIANALEQEFPATNRNWRVVTSSLVDNRAEQFLFALTIAALFVLLVACANIGNLLLARGAARRGELAIRLMMGASRARLTRQLITESAVLALIAGGFGILLSLWGVDLLVALLPVDGMPLWLDFSMDVRVLGYTAAILAAAVFTFGVLPALSTLGRNLYTTARERGRGITGVRSATRTRNALVVGQIALTLILLSSATIVMRSALLTASATPGYDPDPILVADLELADRYPDGAARANYTRAALRELSRIPDVQHVALRGLLRADSTGALMRYGVITAAGGASIDGAYHGAISPNYFETLDLPVLRGRAFNDADGTGAAPVVILSEKAASALWPGEDPIGRSVKFARADGAAQWRTVVGVVANRFQIARGNGGPPRRPMDEAYVPTSQNTDGTMSILIRTRDAAPMRIANDVRRALAAVDPDQQIAQLRPLRDEIYDNVRVLRWLAGLAGAFAAIALVLASIGLFGVIAYVVTQRTREIGIRLALGATPATVIRLMTSIGARLVAAGIGIGLLGAVAVGQILASVVYGVSPRDPLTLAAVALLLGGIALLASWWPARRASNVDPMIALRAD